MFISIYIYIYIHRIYMLVITRGYSIYLRFISEIIFFGLAEIHSRLWSRHLVAGFGKNPCHRFFPHKNWTFGGKPTYFQTHPRVIRCYKNLFGIPAILRFQHIKSIPFKQPLPSGIVAGCSGIYAPFCSMIYHI